MSDRTDHGSMHRADFVTGLVLLAFSVAVVVLSLQMSRLEHRGINPLSAPGVVPGLLGGVIGLFSLILLGRAIRNRGYRLGIRSDSAAAFVRSPAASRITVTVAWCLIYAWGLVGRIDYAAATFIFVLGFVLIFELGFPDERPSSVRRRVVVALIEAVLVAGLVSAVFRYLFLVSLP